MTGFPSSLQPLLSCLWLRAGGGQDRAVSSYSGLLKQVLDFFLLLFSFFFKDLENPIPNSFGDTQTA